MWHLGLVAPRRVDLSSLAGHPTCVPCIARQTLTLDHQGNPSILYFRRDSTTTFILFPFYLYCPLLMLLQEVLSCV